jgi:hypothetical protein
VRHGRETHADALSRLVSLRPLAAAAHLPLRMRKCLVGKCYPKSVASYCRRLCLEVDEAYLFFSRPYPPIKETTKLVTHQERIDDFIHEGRPPTDQPLQILCEDHNGTYVIPFLCRWRDGMWQNAKTSRSIEATVVGWRAPKKQR